MRYPSLSTFLHVFQSHCSFQAFSFPSSPVLSISKLWWSNSIANIFNLIILVEEHLTLPFLFFIFLCLSTCMILLSFVFYHYQQSSCLNLEFPFGFLVFFNSSSYLCRFFFGWGGEVCMFIFLPLLWKSEYWGLELGVSYKDLDVKIMRFWCLIKVRFSMLMSILAHICMYVLENVVFLCIFLYIFVKNPFLYCYFYWNLRKINFQFYSFFCIFMLRNFFFFNYDSYQNLRKINFQFYNCYEYILEFGQVEWKLFILNISTGK